MRPWRKGGRGDLNEVLNQPVATLYLVSYLLKSEGKKTDKFVI